MNEVSRQMFAKADKLEAHAKSLRKRATEIQRRYKQRQIDERKRRRKEFFQTRGSLLYQMREDVGYSWRELGERFGISRERARQVYLQERARRRWEQEQQENREIHARLDELEKLRRPLARFSRLCKQAPEIIQRLPKERV